MRSIWTTVLLTGLIWSLATVALLAQDPTQDDINDVAENLNCPTCQALNLADCRTQTCAQWKDQIGDMLAGGYSEAEILDWYAMTYGEEVLQEPRTQGVGLFAWLLPGLALLAGVAIYVMVLRSWSRPQPVPVVRENEVDEAYLQRIEAELQAKK